MKPVDIPRIRLHNQRLSKTDFRRPEEVVEWLGAVQAQDYAGAKWALGQRMQDAADSTIEQAFSEGKILRTHMMRPTWHFVAPSDIRWVQKLTSPRVRASNAFMDRKLELDQATFRKSHAAIVRALQGGKQSTRAELASALVRAGVDPGNGQRLSYLMMRAELDCLICSGARRGKQFTYALLEERVPQAKELDHDQALTELMRRYFTSHGPATLHDFSWWSSLTLAEIRRGVEMLKPELRQETISGQTFWFTNTDSSGVDWGHPAYLLPNYDEYGIAYKDHSVIFGGRSVSELRFAHLLVIRGQIVGTWKRTLQTDRVLIEFNLFKPLTKTDQRAVARAAERYGSFFGLAALLQES